MRLNNIEITVNSKIRTSLLCNLHKQNYRINTVVLASLNMTQIFIVFKRIIHGNYVCNFVVVFSI